MGRELTVRFDYARSARPMFVRRLLEFRVPPRLHAAAVALAGALAVIGGACGIEAYRLREALTMESVYQARYDAVHARLQETHVYRERVRALVDLDRRVRSIAESGDADARALAEIANMLPAHTWLTGISRDAGGLVLEGDARDLGVLGGVIRNLMHAKHVHRPTLLGAAAADDRRGDAVKYRIHVDGDGP